MPDPERCPHGFPHADHPPNCDTEWEDDGPPHAGLLCTAMGWLCRYRADTGHSDHAPYVEGEYLRHRGADPMTEQPRLHHLLDRMRHGALLPEEAEQLAGMVGELEADRDGEQHRLAFLDRTTLPGLHRRIEHDAETIHRWRGRAESAELRASTAEARVTELETEVVAIRSTVDRVQVLATRLEEFAENALRNDDRQLYAALAADLRTATA
ncbi:hypothetical protein ACFWMX_14770 [Streptomyces sp. NPDC058378]|uniref:hypothetical protein n=1 Tax=Streptomyces sp. NPDC058378 TaxID=3346469 RepID=UPI0036521151